MAKLKSQNNYYPPPPPFMATKEGETQAYNASKRKLIDYAEKHQYFIDKPEKRVSKKTAIKHMKSAIKEHAFSGSPSQRIEATENFIKAIGEYKYRTTKWNSKTILKEKQ